MYVSMKVPECDFTDTKYPEPREGAGAVARGATGRWCVVMYAGPEYLAENNITPIPYDEAVERIDGMGMGNYADF